MQLGALSAVRLDARDGLARLIEIGPGIAYLARAARQQGLAAGQQSRADQGGPAQPLNVPVGKFRPTTAARFMFTGYLIVYACRRRRGLFLKQEINRRGFRLKPA